MKTLIFACLLSIASFSLIAAQPKKAPKHICEYHAPHQPIVDSAFFHSLIFHSRLEEQTFAKMLDYFEKNVKHCHRFQFKYPLKDQKNHQKYVHALQIKAQQAHHFVPEIKSCEFLEPYHLGFRRFIHIAHDGPTIQEHVLMNKNRDQVIFIEETVLEPDGVTRLGTFAAWNGIVKDKDVWYFAGTYLYDFEPDEKEIHKNIHMFDKTYENMESFVEKKDFQAIYKHLKHF